MGKKTAAIRDEIALPVFVAQGKRKSAASGQLPIHGENNIMQYSTINNRQWKLWIRMSVAGAALLAWVFSLAGCGGGSSVASPQALVTSSNPIISFVIPNTGPSTGGTVVTIIGSAIQTNAGVTFGGVPSPTVTFISSAKITAVTPPHAVGAVDVVVENRAASGLSLGSTTLTGGFTYVAPPTITSVSPSVGSIGGGTTVTITGTGFETGATVSFGAVASPTVIVSSATQIVATAPTEAAGTVSVVVTNPDGGTVTAAGAFTYGLPPTITGIAPARGALTGGAIVTLTGTQFQPGAVVTFGGVAGAVTSVSADGTTIVVTSPPHGPGTVDVVVTNPDGRTAILPSSFTFVNSISITSIAPNTGSISGGTAVTITGTAFDPAASVFIGGTAPGSVTVVSSTQITCTTPVHAAGAADVTVNNPDGSTATLTGGFTYTAPTTSLSIVSIAPATGLTAGGTLVTIIGTGFQAAATVTFGGVAGTGVTVTPDGTQIQVTTPAGAATGAVDVVVTNPTAPPTPTSVTSVRAFTYTNPPPTVTSISPSSGPIAGGTTVTLTGTGFLSGATVTVGGVSLTGVVVVSSTQITGVTPAHVAATDDVVVTNTDGQSATLVASFTFSSGTFSIVTNDMPNGNPTAPYFATILTASGTGPYAWSITSGSLPPGLSLNATTGVISGVPTANGTSSFTAQVVDSTPVPGPQTASKAMNLIIQDHRVATLPATFLATTFPDTTSYTVVHLAAGGDLQAAIDSASCNPNGTLIELQSGATYSKTASFRLRGKTCAPGQWIIITTDPSTLPAGTSLPAQGARIDPTYSPILAKLQAASSVSIVQSDCPVTGLTCFNPTLPYVPPNHYWFMGVEMGVTPTNALSQPTENFGLFSVGNGETLASQVPDHIYIDRCYLHGSPTQYVKRGVQVNGTNVAVVDSYISDIHVTGQDSQAIAGWNGPGPIKIVNNFLSAATEIVIFGGADPTILNNVPSDIEIRRNHFMKELSWHVSDPSYAGIHWQVKNFLEIKDAARVLVEENVFEKNWADAQVGFGVLFTPRNQAGACPGCGVSDVTFRYNIERHTASAVDISGSDPDHPSQTSARIIVHDNLFEDINRANWGGDGRLFLMVNAGPGNPLGLLPPTDDTLDHNTGFQSSNALTVGDALLDTIPNFVFTNNIAAYNVNGINGGGVGNGLAGIRAFFPTSVTFVDNVLVGPPSGIPAYPATTFFPASFDPGVGFVDFAGGDFQLAPTSPFHNAGTDGKDIGADVSALNSGTAGAIAPNDR